MPGEKAPRGRGRRAKSADPDRDKSKTGPPPVRGRVDYAAGELFPPRLEEIKGFRALSLEHPEEEDAYSRLLESICGPTDDSQPVEQYDGTLGVTAAFVNAHQAPVGQVQWNANLGTIYNNPGNVSGVRWGSGTLVGNDLFLTAGHLFDQSGGGWQRPMQNGTFNVIPPTEIATNMHVNFNFQVDPAGNLRTEQQFPIVALVEYRLGALDFAVCRLGGTPGTAFGTTVVSTTDAADGEEICIIGHPAGMPKRIEAGHVFHLHDEWIGYDDIDTLGGNSGSGVIRESDGRLVGVHTNGGCTSTGAGHNHGVRIASIIGQSPTLQTLTQPTLKFVDDPGTLKVIDDPTFKVTDDPTLKFSDDPTQKFSDDPTLKFSDDPTQKFSDDPTLKFSDDPTLKFSDDPTLKFSDDPTRKFTDDPTVKFTDDPTVKFTDDGGGGGGTLKFSDDGGGTVKAVDDVKSPALDKQFGDQKIPGSDTFDPTRPPIQPGIGGPQGAQPFILATPHHSMAWAGGAPRGQPGEAQAMAAQYEQALSQLQQLLQQASQEMASLEQQYRRLLGEYQAFTGGQR